MNTTETKNVTNCYRRSILRENLKEGRILRFIESHNPLSALIAENAFDPISKRKFDGFWSSSLTDSTSRGMPDIEKLKISDRINNINDIFSVTTKPMIVDADTGGMIEHLSYDVRSLERAGVSAIVMEDKIGLKKNSLLGNDVFQEQDTIEGFSKKISSAKHSQITDDFMVIARIESLILEKGITDALNRSKAYVEAGADGILIHSRNKDGSEILQFIDKFRLSDSTTPIVIVPTSYSHIKSDSFEEAGANVIIYANHLLRSSYSAMMGVANNILRFDRTSEVEDDCLSVKKILELIPGTI